MIKEIQLSTKELQDWYNITGEVQKVVTESGVLEGFCLVHNPHSTAALFLNSYLDPMTPKDILHDFDRLIPTRVDFFHQFDTPTDAAAHIKSVLMGSQAMIIIHEGKLLLGSSQGIIFAEFDGPRERKVIVKVSA